MVKCSIENCNRKNWGRGYCMTHYKRFVRHGTASPRVLIKTVGRGNPRFCHNNLCYKFMERGSFRYKSGLYCDAQCQAEAREARRKPTRSIKGVARVAQTIFPHKHLHVELHVPDNTFCRAKKGRQF